MLTDTECRKATCPPDRKHRRITDSGGLYLEVSAASKRWFCKVYASGKESRMALGRYPDMTLKAARAERDGVRKTQHTGANPIMQRKAAKLARALNSATTFEAVARDFHATKRDGWSENHAAQWLRSVEKDLFPWLGALALHDVTAPVLLGALQRVERRSAIYSAHALRTYAGQVFRHGIATGKCERNPAADLGSALKPYVVKNMAAILEPVAVGGLLRAVYAYSGHPCTRAALVLSALLFQRPGNIRAMEWAEIDTDAALWTIPAGKMKRGRYGKVNGRPHLTPLAPQALAILADLRPLTGHGKFVFPSVKTGERCMSENTVTGALRNMGFTKDEITAHGFRATARTLMTERLPDIPAEVIEAQLAHGKSGPLGTAYDRAEFMAQRRTMMAVWADYLDRLRDGAQVLPFKAA